MKLKNIKNIADSKLFRSAGIYTLTNIINSAIPFLLLPILTRYLSPKDYGIVSMFGVLVSIIAPFTGLSIHGAIERVYYEKDTVNIKEYIANCLLILIFSTSIVSVLFFFFSEFISMISSIPEKMLWLAIVISFAQFLSRIVLTLWQVQIKPVQFGVYQISQTITNMFLSIIFIVVIGLAWQGRIYAQLITAILFSLFAMIVLVKNNWLKINYNKLYIKHALNFGIPLIPHALGGVIMTMTDRLFITNMVGIEATGIYTVGYQIGMIINIIATSFNQAYTPWLYMKLKENIMATKVKIVKLTYIYFCIIMLLAIGLSIIAPTFLEFFVGKNFNQSTIYVTWIALGYAFNGMYFMVTNYVFYAQRTSYLAGVTIISAFLNIGLNYIFIRNYGAIGAAQATTTIYLIKFILTWIVSANVYNMPWNLKRNTQ